jgi:hypothetical protein
MIDPETLNYIDLDMNDNETIALVYLYKLMRRLRNRIGRFPRETYEKVLVPRVAKKYDVDPGVLLFECNLRWKDVLLTYYLVPDDSSDFLMPDDDNLNP